MILPEIANGEDKTSPFINCIRNSYRHIRKWAKREQTNCFRIYDRQMYEYPLAIDFYAGRYCVHYFSQDRDAEPPQEVVDEVQRALIETFRADPQQIFWRSRIRRAKLEQYEKQAFQQEFFSVLEYGVTFLVNLVDYLDTGLFLDHREMRRFVALQAAGKRVLNLFAYTCSFSVHAAMQGATFTKSVDMSNTYTRWGRDNFNVNGLSAKSNEIVRADCLIFLDEEREKYDIIIVDPPTVSRSKKMEQLFDIQVDYISLLSKALKRLSPNGTLFFSTNFRKFNFGPSHFPSWNITEITAKTHALDFHDPKIHRCWQFVSNIVGSGLAI